MTKKIDILYKPITHKEGQLSFVKLAYDIILIMVKT